MAFPKAEGNVKLNEKINESYKAIPDLDYEGHTGEIDDILSALENGTVPLITGKDGKTCNSLLSKRYCD